MNRFEKGVHLVRENGAKLSGEVREKTVGYIAAALGLVAGLAWNDAIKALINFTFPIERNSVLAQFLYAVAITIVVVIVTVYLLKVIAPEKETEPK